MTKKRTGSPANGENTASAPIQPLDATELGATMPQPPGDSPDPGGDVPTPKPKRTYKKRGAPEGPAAPKRDIFSFRQVVGGDAPGETSLEALQRDYQAIRPVGAALVNQAMVLGLKRATTEKACGDFFDASMRLASYYLPDVDEKAMAWLGFAMAGAALYNSSESLAEIEAKKKALAEPDKPDASA